jgi:Cys-rich repeat protein
MRSQARLTVFMVLSGVGLAAGCSSGGSSKGSGGSPGSGGRDGGGGEALGTGGGSGGTAGGTGGNTAGTGGTAPTDAAVPANDLAKACASNADCGGGLICAGAGDNVFASSGPAHGYCTKACGDEDGGDLCNPLGGVCVNMGTTTTAAPFCLLGCTFGGMDRGAKCRGRNDVGCASLSDGAGAVTVDVCVPLCAVDADCPSGRRCDQGTGLCTATPKAGDPLGAACSPPGDGGTNTCAGLCLPVGAGAGGTAVAARFCSQPCVLGSPTACNLAIGTTPLAGASHGGCVLITTGGQLGDVGFCAQECDTAADCLNKRDPGGMCDVSISAGSPIAPHGFCTW